MKAQIWHYDLILKEGTRDFFWKNRLFFEGANCESIFCTTELIAAQLLMLFALFFGSEKMEDLIGKLKVKYLNYILLNYLVSDYNRT